MTADPLFLLGAHPANAGDFAGLAHVLGTANEVRDAYARNRRARWVVVDSSSIALLAKTAEAHDTWHRLLVLGRATTFARRELLHALFRVVIAPDDGVRLLPKDELLGVVADEHAEDLFIGGVVDREDQALVLYRGNLDRLVVPLRWFKPRPKGPRPDFGDFDVIDSGQTVRFGKYEAAADAILYELDADARRRMRAREVEEDSSFGGSLRRLRLQKGLSREDFHPISPKTVARIERGEVEAPRGDTLDIIAKRVGVTPKEIRSY